VPITPLHLGPALLLKRAAGSKFNLAAFIIAQVLLDLEPVLKILGLVPIQGGLHLSHTWPTGAGVVLVAAAASAWGFRWLGQKSPTAWIAAVSAALGVLSHLVLDAVYHADVAASIGLPGLSGVVSQGWLDAWLLVALVAGLAVSKVRW
jgi:hypothetical protein